MKLLKKNQVIIYVIVLMLMTVAYLNYTTQTEEQSVETSMQMEARDDSNTSNIGDATLVSSNDVSTDNETDNDISNTNSTNIVENEITTNTTQTNSIATSTDDYFTKSKLERDTMYSQMLETYEKVLNSNNSLETQKQSATEEIKKINNLKNSIMICENLIQTKGFNDVVVFVNDDSISVVVATTELTKENVAQIQNIIARELKVEVDNIHISNK